jgi:hypothetical protein
VEGLLLLAVKLQDKAVWAARHAGEADLAFGALNDDRVGRHLAHRRRHDGLDTLEALERDDGADVDVDAVLERELRRDFGRRGDRRVGEEPRREQNRRTTCSSVVLLSPKRKAKNSCNVTVRAPSKAHRARRPG